MDPIQSQINQIEARIKQIQDSELFTPEEKKRYIAKEEADLEKQLMKKADAIIITNPETIE